MYIDKHRLHTQDCPRPGVKQSGKATLACPPIADMANLGPRSQSMLAIAGISTVQQLRELGAVEAFMRVQSSGGRPSLNLLWALEGALTNTHWTTVSREHRTSLLLALEQRRRGVG